MSEQQKIAPEKIREIEEEDALVRILYDCMGNISADVRNAIRERILYFFGISV